MTTINMYMKFEIEIPKQTWLTLRKPCHIQSPEIEKSNMAAILKMTLVKIIWLLPIYISVVLQKCEVDIQIKLESGNQKVQYESDVAENQ